MTKIIPLTQGKVAKVDDDKFEYLSKWKWYYSSEGYAARNGKTNPTHEVIYMHREIIKAPVGMEVDHINGDRTDNHLSNLRLCTKAQNQINIGIRRNNTSGFKGVYFDKWTNKWHSQIVINGKRKNLGRYNTAEEAAKAYDKSAKANFGEFVRLNFPEG